MVRRHAVEVVAPDANNGARSGWHVRSVGVGVGSLFEVWERRRVNDGDVRELIVVGVASKRIPGCVFVDLGP